MDIFEILDKKFSLSKKTSNLHSLLCEDKYFEYNGYSVTFEVFFDLEYFKTWEFSLGCKDLKEFKQEIGIYVQDGCCFPENDEELIFKFLQYSFNVVKYVSDCENKKGISYHQANETEFFNIFAKDFEYILSKISQEIIKHPDKNYYILVPCNEKTKTCAQRVQSENSVYLLYEYTSYQLKGNVLRKQEILQILWNEVEPLISRNKNKYKSGKIYDIYDTLGSFYNNFNIRHNNTSSDIPGKFKIGFSGFDKQEIEEIYDLTYDLILDAIILDNYDSIDDKYKKYLKRLKDDNNG